MPYLDITRTSQEVDAATPSTEAWASLRSADQSLTRSQSLPQEATQPLEADAQEPIPVDQAKPAISPESEQPMSPPPNTLWNTPRASDRYCTTHLPNLLP